MMKVQRHGGGPKGGNRQKGNRDRDKYEVSLSHNGAKASSGRISNQKCGCESRNRIDEELLNCAVIRDKGYDRKEFRWYVRGNNNTPVITGVEES